MRSKIADLLFLPIFILTNLLMLPVAVTLDVRDRLGGKRA